MLQKHSLTRTTLIKMGLRIALVIIAVTLLSYWHLMSVLQSQTKEQLSKYITERGLRESHLFKLAETHHAIFKQEFVERYQRAGEEDPQERFNQLFEKKADGTIRLRPEEFQGVKRPHGAVSKGMGGFIGRGVTVTPEIRRRLVVAYEIINTYAPAWDAQFQNFYISAPENMSILHWPTVNWFAEMPADMDITKEEWVYSANIQHNPTRKTAWTGILYDSVSKDWMTTCVTPIDIAGRHLLSSGNDILLNELFERSIGEHLEGTYNLIFREDGRLIVHPEYLDQIMKHQGNFNIAQASDPHLQRLFQLVTNKPANTVVVDNTSDAEYLAVTRLQGPNWYFVTVYPKSLLSSLAFQTARFILLLGMLSLLIEVLVLFWVLKTQVARPLRAFQEATEQLANGDFTVQLDTSRQDELGRLANSFETMAQELKLREERLATSNQQLTQEIVERKQIEVELHQAKDLAEAANRAKSVFLANMSHELRTPLNGILGYAQIFSRDMSLSAKQQEGIRIIQESGNYLFTLITDVLDLSKIEAGRVELYLTDFNFTAFLHNLRDLFQLRAKQQGLTFAFEAMSRLPQGLHGDEKRLRQVLINLLSNAIKFTQQGGVIFQVDYEQGKLRFQISDTGIGIAPTDLAKIFTPFQQFGDPNYRPEGTGLGLSITKRLVELMGGELQVDSHLGQGSTFTVLLDLPESSEFQPEEIDRPVIIGFQLPPHSPLSARGEVPILVIDDKWENRSVLVHLLTPLGFKVLEASHGQAGLEIARRCLPALIISDLVMPVMDGFEFARQLRQRPEFKTVPMIAATASVFDLHSPESLSAGYDEVIAKPLQVELLWQLLEKHLGLTWTYAQQPLPATNIAKEKEEPEEAKELLVGPAKEQVAILFELAMIGDIAGILEEVDKLEQQDPQLRPFVAKIRQLALSFEEARISEMVERYMV